MIPFMSVFVVLVLQLYEMNGSNVHLGENGYEDIVIAINPLVPEDQMIVTNIKKMVNEASFYMFIATKRKFYFRNVKILLPASWKSNNYQKRKHESYEKASVIVADPFLKYGDDPYTLQYGGCGERGKYIHLTPNFLLKDSLLSVYGPRGRVFVHEWAHLRWGVFDEYNNDQPFYISGQNQIKATRCSADLSGIIMCDGSSCTEGDCMIGTEEGHLKEGCTFIPDETQNVMASIMYMQALSSVVHFCDESNHNLEAPHMQNKMCNYQSTWEVIKGSSDYQITPPMNNTDSPPPPSISLLQVKEQVICLVLDVSRCMNMGDRISRMRQAAETFLLQIVETGSHVGIVTFDDRAEIRTPLMLITSEHIRKQLVSYLPTTANGGSHICKGLRSALQVIQKLDNNTYGSEIVLLTAGEDSTINGCFSDVATSGSTIHTIALGPKAVEELEQLADMTEGFKFAATDKLDSNSLIDAFTRISSGSGNLSQQCIQLESVAEFVEPGQQLTGTVTFDSTVGNETFFLVTWQPGSEAPTILLQDPNENNYSMENFVPGSTLGSARLEIPDTAEAGNWTFKIVNTLNYSQVLSMTVTSRAAHNDVPPVNVKAHMSMDTLSFPDPMLVYVQVSQGFSPVLEAQVTAIIEHELGNPVILELADDGAGGDAVKNDGVYSKYFFSPTANGRHNLKVRVQGKSDAPILGYSPSWSHAMYVPGYIENGKIQMNPPRPSFNEDEMRASTGGFSRTATGGSFIVSQVPSGPQADVFPPCKIVDLRVETEGGNVYLSWTAPGDNYDQGQASIYEIKMSESPVKLRDHFENATALNTSALTPQPAAFRETVIFKLKDVAIENSTVIYFAICAIDKASLRSDVSNVAQATMWVQSAVIGKSAAKDDVSNEIFIVIGAIAATCFVISATIIYALKKAIILHSQRHSNSYGIAAPQHKIQMSQEAEVVLLG